MSHFDVIIVGAGPAGTAAAYDLAEAGRRVLLLDKKDFPRFKACAGGITIKGLKRLRYSIAPVIRRRCDTMELGYGRRQPVLGAAAGAMCAMTIRSEFDEFNWQQAQRAGARFEVIDEITEIREEADGIELITRSGQNFSANVLLAADGARSQVRRLTGDLSLPNMAIAIEARVPRDNLREMPPMTLDWGEVPYGYGWLFPKHDHVNVGLYTIRPQQVDLSKQALRSYVEKRLQTDQLEHIVGFPLGTGGHGYQPRSSRLLLIGDAAGWVDPLLGEGIHNAIKSGQQAAQAILRQANSESSLPELFLQETAEIRRDVYNGHRVAQLFYRFLPVAYSLLIRYPLRPAAMNGFAAGLTLSECKRHLQRMHVRPPPLSTPSLQEYEARLAD